MYLHTLRSARSLRYLFSRGPIKSVTISVRRPRCFGAIIRSHFSRLLFFLDAIFIIIDQKRVPRSAGGLAGRRVLK